MTNAPTTTNTRRSAIFTCGRNQTPTELQMLVKAYLPENYRVSAVLDNGVLIDGHDHCGWTLDDYVLPRLASAGKYGVEIVG